MTEYGPVWTQVHAGKPGEGPVDSPKTRLEVPSLASVRLAGFAARLAAGKAEDRAGDQPYREEPEIHQGGRLSDRFSQHGRQIEINRTAVVHPDQNQKQEDCADDHEFQ